MSASHAVPARVVSPGGEMFVLLRGILWWPWLVAGITMVGTLAALLAAWLMPPVYQATARILVESQQIPDDLARSTVTASAAERLAVIEQRLMTRSNLLDMAHRLELFADQKRLTPTDRVELLREKTRIDSISFNGNPRYRGPTQVSAFTITFEGQDARQSALVANEFVEMVLAQNLAARSARASETHDFFKAELERVTQQMDALETEIAAFKARNHDHLPEALNLRLSELSGLRQQVGVWTQRISRIETRMVSFSEQPFRQGVVGSESGHALVDPMTEGQLDLLREKQRLAKERIATVQASIDRTTRVEMELNAMQRRFDLLRLQHKDALHKATRAATGEKLEDKRQAERFEVLEQAQVPETPVAPRREFIALGGALASFSMAVAFAGLLEWMSRILRTGADFQRLLNVRPVLIVPPIQTRRERNLARNRKLAVGFGVVAAIVSVLWFAPIERQASMENETGFGERLLAFTTEVLNTVSN